MAELHRLLRPRSIAVVGGGTWGANVLRACQQIGFEGALWPVHPRKAAVAGVPAFADIAALPAPPDAAFLGVNRHAAIAATRALADIDAGGAVCFASGFAEAAAELPDGDDLQAALLHAAGDMPVLGPNCYGFLNALDHAALWPDIHGLTPVGSGVAILTQSSNIALNLTMQRRGLPIAYLITAGNQAQQDLSALGIAVLEDSRVTALGLYIEGVGDLRRFEALAEASRALGKPIVALKMGASDQARAATISHTASLAGSDAGARALLARLGIAQVDSLAALLETLKLLHGTGPLPSNRIASLSCSGGEACLMADAAEPLDLAFPPLKPAQQKALRKALGPKVALANPLDYHTYIWGDRAALTACFTAMMADSDLALGCVVLDFPHDAPAPDWDLVAAAVAATRAATGVAMALVSSLPDTMPEAVARAVMGQGIVPLAGLPEALEAVAAAAWLGRWRPVAAPLLLPGAEPAPKAAITLGEAQAKAALGTHGLDMPQAIKAAGPEAVARAAAQIGVPVVVKGQGLTHKTDAGAVALNLTTPDAARAAAEAMPTSDFLVEEQITGALAELLVSVIRDPAHGFILTLGAGGVMTELWADVQHLLVPADPDEIDAALTRLRIAPLLSGFRGAPPVSRSALRAAIMAVQEYALAAPETLLELEVNPLICRADRAVACDALIRRRKPPP
ncbi:MAG: acetate--CoA ligase family protein [Pseudomonadota bacterium]